jgi:hypothetical protein
VSQIGSAENEISVYAVNKHKEVKKMKKSAVLAGVVCVFALAFAVAAQDAPKVAGMWNVTINTPGQPTTEQWTVQQDGSKLTGKVKTANGEVPLEGTLEGTDVHVKFMNGDTPSEIRANIAGDSIDGTCKVGKAEFLWHAKRAG